MSPTVLKLVIESGAIFHIDHNNLISGHGFLTGPWLQHYH